MFGVSGWMWLSLRSGLIFHSVTAAFEDDGLSVPEKAVADRGGDGAVVVEAGGPLFEGLFAGGHDGSAFVALADDSEK